MANKFLISSTEAFDGKLTLHFTNFFVEVKPKEVAPGIYNTIIQPNWLCVIFSKDEDAYFMGNIEENPPDDRDVKNNKLIYHDPYDYSVWKVRKSLRSVIRNKLDLQRFLDAFEDEYYNIWISKYSSLKDLRDLLAENIIYTDFEVPITDSHMKDGNVIISLDEIIEHHHFIDSNAY